MNLYLDTNVFLSAVEPTDPFHTQAQELLKHVELQNTNATTSTETFQEIVHVAKKQKRLDTGVKLCRILFKLIPLPLGIDTQVISKFLDLIIRKPKLEARDCLHIAVCLINKIPFLVTEDEAMQTTAIAELTCISIKEALTKY